ncbi:hypothetical protein NLX83_17755 [Allokutzneria sp. A3M-2-11 16]|uniref:hypothetical protein n=1 Tax=Allokutzneria sp. A3M-2-11 16 TaxID=2962043 RepID=UPI0020B7371B|nr:hypothetical protein [Allokutzneria sp. A3M-2-11 16]MCP3801109.1 hypothetical protein [Allokutzneria sp. A3M-2-11 16]
MDALDLLRTLRRRWALAMVLAIGLAALLTSLAFMVPQQYRVNASMLVLRAYGGADRNPYAAVDPSQGQAAMMLLRVVGTPAVQQRMAQQGATAELEITNESAGSVAADSPFITVIATGATADSARTTAQVAMRELRFELKRKQDQLGVPQEGHLTLSDIVPADTVTTTRSAQLRALAIGGGVGLALLLCVVVMVDRAQQRRTEVPFALARKDSSEPEPVDPAPSVQQAAELAHAARSAVERVKQASRPALDRPTDVLNVRYQAARVDDHDKASR